MNRILLMMVMLGASLTNSFGAETAKTVDPALVEQLLQRIDTLERRVAALEQKQTLAATATPTAIASSPTTMRSIDPVQDTSSHREMMNAQELMEPQYPSLHIHGFADVNFSAMDHSSAPSGFNLGELVLHMASPLSKRISVFGEISFEPLHDGFDVDVERAFIRYDLNDHFKASFGRYHTPTNYWNTAYHHGTWLQTTISRPEMLFFDGPFLPAHMVGLQTEGSISSGNLGLGYVAGLGNGRSFSLHEPGQAGDSNNNRAFVLSLYARPKKLSGLQIGGSFYNDKLSFQPEAPAGGLSAPVPNFREWIASGHVVWTEGAPEFLAEFSNIRHSPVGGGQDFDTQVFYVQAAYRLPWQEKKWKPYYRFEYSHAPLGDPFLLEAPHDLRLSILGMRYEISTFAAFKAEYRNRQQQSSDPNVNGVFLQTSFTF